jgi:TolA-binding protein
MGEVEDSVHQLAVIVATNHCQQRYSFARVIVYFVKVRALMRCRGTGSIFVFSSSHSTHNLPHVSLGTFSIECTYSHFNDSSRCPSCGKSLGANDFMELVVADPSTATEETLKNTFQTIFTKFSSSSNSLSHQEMCTRLLKSFDNERRTMRFLLKQFVVDASCRGQRSGGIARDLDQIKKEYTTLKQASSSQRIQLEQTIADLQHRVQALNGTVQELQKKLDEKDIQITQFRQLYAAEGMARVPSSSHSGGSGGKRGGGGAAVMYPQHHGNGFSRPVVSSSSAATPPPPLQGFVLQKQAREEARAQALGDMTRSRVIPVSAGAGKHQIGDHTVQQRRRNSIDSVITPIQVMPSSRMGMTHLSPLNQVATSSSHMPSTPRIRELSASSGYVFTSRSNRQNQSQRHHDVRSTNIYENIDNNNGKRNRSISPRQQQNFGFGRISNQQQQFGSY